MSQLTWQYNFLNDDTHMGFPENYYILQWQYAESQVNVVWSVYLLRDLVCVAVSQDYQKVIV